MKKRFARYTKWLPLILSMSAAMPAVAAGGYSGVQLIDSMRTHASGSVSIAGATSKWNNPDACKKNNRVVLPAGHAYFREMYASILAAQVSGLEVRFNLLGCIKVDNVQYPKIKDVEVYTTPN